MVTHTGDREFGVVSGRLPNNLGELACMHICSIQYLSFFVHKFPEIMFWPFTDACKYQTIWDQSIFQSIQGTLNSWKGTGLTLIGKIQTVKSFIIPKLLSKAALISVPEDHVKEINNLIYHIIWKGNDKIKWSALINDINAGGLKMLDIHSMICFTLAK